MPHLSRPSLYDLLIRSANFAVPYVVFSSLLLLRPKYLFQHPVLEEIYVKLYLHVQAFVLWFWQGRYNVDGYLIKFCNFFVQQSRVGRVRNNITEEFICTIKLNRSAAMPVGDWTLLFNALENDRDTTRPSLCSFCNWNRKRAGRTEAVAFHSVGAWALVTTPDKQRDGGFVFYRAKTCISFFLYFFLPPPFLSFTPAVWFLWCLNARNYYYNGFKIFGSRKTPTSRHAMKGVRTACPSYREAFHSVHFRIALISLIFELNAYIQLNICIVY